MSLLMVRAYLKLIYFDFYLARGNFAALYQKVRNCPIGTSAALPDVTERICAAVDMACIWYWKEVLCLQRSAATACLLKRYRSSCTDDDRSTADAIQGARLGRSRRASGQ